MSVSDRHLTAARFNSVALNIADVFNNGWLWQYNPRCPIHPLFTSRGRCGFTERVAFRGVSDVSDPENADNVFGWYLYELTRALNVMIDMLSDNADWGELQLTTPDIIDRDLSLSAVHVAGLKRVVLYAIDRDLQLAVDPARVLQRVTLYAINRDLRLNSDPARALKRVKLYAINRVLALGVPQARTLRRITKLVTDGVYRLYVPRVRSLARTAIIHSRSGTLILGTPYARALRSNQSVPLTIFHDLRLTTPAGICLPGLIHDSQPEETLDIRLALMPSVLIQSATGSESSDSSSVRAVSAGALVEHGISSSEDNVTLTTLRIMLHWCWPVQTGSDLYVRQTYYIRQNGTDLYLGRGNNNGT